VATIHNRFVEWQRSLRYFHWESC